MFKIAPLNAQETAALLSLLEREGLEHDGTLAGINEIFQDLYQANVNKDQQHKTGQVNPSLRFPEEAIADFHDMGLCGELLPEHSHPIGILFHGAKLKGMLKRLAYLEKMFDDCRLYFGTAFIFIVSSDRTLAGNERVSAERMAEMLCFEGWDNIIPFDSRELNTEAQLCKRVLEAGFSCRSVSMALSNAPADSNTRCAMRHCVTEFGMRPGRYAVVSSQPYGRRQEEDTLAALPSGSEVEMIAPGITWSNTMTPDHVYQELWRLIQTLHTQQQTSVC